MIPHPGTVLVIGRQDEDREELVQHFIADALKKNRETVYMAVDKHPDEIVEKLRNFVDIDNHIQSKKIHFIDCYSAAKNLESSKDFTIRVDPRNLKKVHRIVTGMTSKKEKPERVVVDSLSGLLKFNNPMFIESFIDVTIRKLKKKGATILLLLDDDAHPTHKADLEVLTDMTLRLHEHEEKKLISLYGLVDGKRVQHQIEKGEFFEQNFYN
ncbi:MAG: hypothetical protein B6U68_04090 [Candidatus Aenigmarchaeota archaeon ex4484_14]|nr:MAG: hypothetical protein B6U68_04090 [Candidatus Aenigmarchaeota archaeon ex4484_14]